MAGAKIKLGEPIDIHLSRRYYQFNRSHAMRDVFDALVELFTNCDDSYHRLFQAGLRQEDGGPILLEYLCAKTQSSLIIHDRAEGMTLEEMREKLGDVGTKRSQEGDRGFMARGAKDCSELGTLIFESIKDDRYYKCELNTRPQFIPLENGSKAMKATRERLHISRGNGTVATLRLDQSAQHKSVSRYLGAGPEFAGQNSPLFRVLLAEIVAESICRKSLILESKERTWEFRWADLKEDHLIADDVFAKVQQRIRAFVADTHMIMLGEYELAKFQE